jgi:carbon storage regulator
MLILTRRTGEVIDVTLEDGRRIALTIMGVKGNQVRVGIDAPRTVVVDRAEITKRKWVEDHPERVNGNVI